VSNANGLIYTALQRGGRTANLSHNRLNGFRIAAHRTPG
jgi:hypothetical protein